MADRPTADEYVATVRRLQAAAEADQRHLVALITFLTGEAPTGPVQAWEVTDALGVVLGIDASRVGEDGYTLRSVLWGDGKLPPIANRYRATRAMWAAREIERAAWAVLVGLAPEPGEVSP